MSEHPSTSRSLTEIGHLFLSSVRERQTNGAPMPRRQPPERVSLSVPTPPQLDVAIEVPSIKKDHTNVTGLIDSTPLDAEKSPNFPPVTAVLSAHLNDKQSDYVKQYARHLARDGTRVGLIELDATEFRLLCFDQQGSDEGTEISATAHHADASIDSKTILDALEELNWDLDHWLVVFPNLRATGTRELLNEIGHWMLLSTCDHDGVISCYRTLKVIQNIQRPRLSLSVVDAQDDQQAEKVYRKLQSVCGQFLNWSLDSEPRVLPTSGVAEHVILNGIATGKPSAAGVPPQWDAVTRFITRAKKPASRDALLNAWVEDEVDASPVESKGMDAPKNDSADAHRLDLSSSESSFVEPEAEVQAVRSSNPFPQVKSEASDPMARAIKNESNEESFPFPAAQPGMRWAGGDTAESQNSISEVIDLPDAHLPGNAILPAILRNESSQLIECPVTPPMCPEARLAVTRDRRIVLLAAARRGLGDLRLIARAYNWLTENHKLLCMAMPQLSIDPSARPCLRLFIDHADLAAEILQPMLQSNTVTVQAYRRLRWGGKTGLLLEAA